MNSLWNAIDGDPLTSVLVMTPGARVLHANTQAARFLVEPSAEPSTLQNRSIEDALPRTAGLHYAQLLSQVQSSGTPLLLREIWQGRQLVTRFQFVRFDRGDDAAYVEGVFLAVGRRVEGSLEDALSTETDATRLIAPYVHLGPLSVLSDRELEVLSLLCTGLTAKDIAKRLDRSFKTVENHRYVIGRKLGATDRHALAAIAIRAGLTSMDALRDRL
jgi:DNA-binding CsgD family transcriptional regulator